VTPERWDRIGELFDAAVTMSPSEREDWLGRACGGDADLRAHVAGLLEQDDQAVQSAFLADPHESPQDLNETPDWRSNPVATHGNGPSPRDPHEGAEGDQSRGFIPKAAIAAGEGDWLADETRALVRTRLREMALIYALIFGMFVILRPFLLGLPEASISTPFWGAMIVLGGLAVYLSRARPLSLARLRLLELGMVIALASFITFYQTSRFIERSVGKDPIRAQLVMKNFVLLTSILILTYGIYVPKSWRRAAVVSGALALIPLASILGSYLGYPKDLVWVFERRDDGLVPMRLFGVDAVFLLTLAAISAFGAHTITGLRQQVVEARQLGQYRLGRRIGSGGMGDVYLAEHQLLKRPCAVKLIRPGELLKSGTIKRFEREVRINATLSHPNIVEIFDYGRTEDGVYYYVMEYLPGLSLAELVARHGPLPPERAVHLLRQVCLALHEAHDAGVIHRDIKPSNIFAARRGGRDDVAKLLDFGLVQPAPTKLSADPSREGQIVGTPLYISPEQALGERKLDARSDIYSLGAVAYFLLTGRPPFDEGSAIAAIIAHARDQASPPSQFRADLPADLERVVMRCLAKPRTDRYPDAESLELALAECACAGKWDKAQARRWWREKGQIAVASSEEHARHPHPQVGIDHDQLAACDQAPI
jgi:tRNA A-37 threonylcarbamoyl transferase component Bud32